MSADDVIAAAAPAVAPIEFKVTRGMGAIVAPGDYVHADGTAYTFLRATRPTAPGRAGKVVVTRDGHQAELYASVFGLTVSRIIPQHDDPSGRWCPFSGVSQPAGECPVHDGPEAA